MDINSKALFEEHLVDLKIAGLCPEFIKLGWSTFGLFAFAIPNGTLRQSGRSQHELQAAPPGLVGQELRSHCRQEEQCHADVIIAAFPAQKNAGQTPNARTMRRYLTTSRSLPRRQNTRNPNATRDRHLLWPRGHRRSLHQPRTQGSPQTRRVSCGSRRRVARSQGYAKSLLQDKKQHCALSDLRPTPQACQA